MTARANIAVDDGETTPVTHTFTPQRDLNTEVSRWINLNASVPAASEIITLGVRDSKAAPEEYSTPGKKVSPRSVDFRIKYPATYVEAVSGLTLVDYVDEVMVTFKIHPRSSQQRAENLRTMCFKALQDGTNGNQIIYAIDKGENVW